MKFNQTSVGTVVTEFYGPWTGHNYTGAVAPVCAVRLLQIGASGSAVKVQSNIVAIHGYGPSSGSATLVPNPANWVDVATVNTAGLSNVTLTAQTVINWIRVIVTVPGTNPEGECLAGGRWDKPL